MPPTNPTIPAPAAPAAAVLPLAALRRLKKLAAARYLRSIEALKLYEPLPKVEEFHRCRARTRLVRGSNRAGKTLATAVEAARKLTGQDPYGKSPLRDGRMVAVALDEENVGAVLYRKLCKPGAFKIVRDLATQRWRAFRPLQDKGREAECRPAPPLIPKRFVRDVVWGEKKKGVPRMLLLTTGWEVTFFSSKAAPPQGWDIDDWWIDEECVNEAWVPELQARVLDRKGSGMWGATPQVANPQLYDLSCRAEEDRDGTAVAEFLVKLADNPHIAEEEKTLFAANLTEEERRVRVEGEFLLLGSRIYPEFSPKLHGFDGAGWQVPPHWARYLLVDPWRQVCAVLCVAIPPPAENLKEQVYFAWELYLRACDAEKFGLAVAGQSVGVVYEAFVIDRHASKVTEMGSGRTVEEQYSTALKRHGVSCRQTGTGFQWGSDDPKGRILAVRELLRQRMDGTARLQYPRGRLPNLEWEAGRYHYARIKRLVTDEPVKKNDHLMDCAGYAATFPLRYHKPPTAKAATSSAVRSMKKKKAEKALKRRHDRGHVSLGSRSA